MHLHIHCWNEWQFLLAWQVHRKALLLCLYEVVFLIKTKTRKLKVWFAFFFHSFWFVLNYRSTANSHVFHINAGWHFAFEMHLSEMCFKIKSRYTEDGELCSLLDVLDMVLFGQFAFEIQLLLPPHFHTVVY